VDKNATATLDLKVVDEVKAIAEKTGEQQ
jgi:hypothetical protein